MNTKIQFYLRLFFVIIGLTGFTVLFVSAFVQTFRAQGNPPIFSEPFTIAATTLAGLIGGIAAIGLGASLPERLKAQSKAKVSQHFLAFGKQLAPQQAEDLQFTMAAIYAGLYILIGLSAWVTWISHPDTTPPLVKDLAGIVLGLGVAVVQNFFRAQPPPEIRKRH
ncbi:MAG: hypothetical protein IT308_06385 [Anaerolineaceae bacterium]|nr:hypothetical protein [Anaerolineaceae bacterium]